MKVLTELEVETGRRFGRPETKSVDTVVAVSRNWTIVGHRKNRLQHTRRNQIQPIISDHPPSYIYVAPVHNRSLFTKDHSCLWIKTTHNHHGYVLPSKDDRNFASWH